MAERRFPEVDGRFRDRVYEIVRLVPYGKVTTYGFVSTLAGMPRHARQVGWALHTLPEELVWGVDEDVRHRVLPAQAGAGEGDADRIDPAMEARKKRVPWHRVVNAKGQVSTHPDDAGTYRQMDLLREEGLEVTEDGVIVGGLAAHQWVPDPAEVDRLELPAEVLFALDKQLDRQGTLPI
jgi:methylated-DNA-protein-cysteine methyltransferase related protein